MEETHLKLGVAFGIGLGVVALLLHDFGVGNGPLVLPDSGTTRMAPASTRTWATLSGCTEEPMSIEIESVEALSTWSEADLTWWVSWPEDGEQETVGAAGGRVPRSRYARVTDDPGGRSAACGDGREGPVLAVQFPRATNRDVGFDSYLVHYTAGGTRYTAEYRRSIGVCASDPQQVVSRCDSE